MKSVEAANEAVDLFEKYPNTPKDIRELVEKLIRSNFKYEKEAFDAKEKEGK